MNHLEDAECIALMQWVLHNLKKYPDLEVLKHSPNGGKRNVREAARLKAMGVMAGDPDYHLPVARGKHHSLYIEMKRPKRGKSPAGRVSKLQHEVMDMLTYHGNLCMVCWGWESARDTLVGYLCAKLE